MALHFAPFLVFMMEMVALQHMCLGETTSSPVPLPGGTSSHSLKILLLAVLDSNRTVSQCIIQGYVDSQISACYDSNSIKIEPRVSWVEKFEKEDPQYWQFLTHEARRFAHNLGEELKRTRPSYHNIKDLHTQQIFARCESQENRNKEDIWMYKVALNGEALFTDYSFNPLMDECLHLLEKCLFYRNETLTRTETPVVTMSSRMEVDDGMETHVCRMYGFYPREIDASWMRDGKVWLQNTLPASVAPNADGTYHYCLSIRVGPKERGRYRCHVEHGSLKEPLDLELNVLESNMGFTIGCIVAGLVVTCVIIGSLIFLRRHSCSWGRVQGSTST
ncbi:major histocompatibility complex class I-related gene protein-like [Erythrolamprus reginae]|uniref:major histocompatibility complex class I-related gene protein-like n=1 Tax=Erythrolamprus reginae TaxID=121349 RepID=UPI00396CEE25